MLVTWKVRSRERKEKDIPADYWVSKNDMLIQVTVFSIPI